MQCFYISFPGNFSLFYLVISNPIQIAKKPHTTLRAMYNNEVMISPLEARLKDSKEKEEKVVNPPQNPTIKREYNLGDTTPFLFNKPKSIPKIRHPTMFTLKVAKGKVDFQVTKNNRLTKNLQHEPTNPPIPARNKSFHINKKPAKILAGVNLLKNFYYLKS